MLKIISANVNGIRSAYKKGFYEYIAASGADIVCVQELKAQEADLSDEMKNPQRSHVSALAQFLGAAFEYRE